MILFTHQRDVCESTAISCALDDGIIYLCHAANVCCKDFTEKSNITTRQLFIIEMMSLRGTQSFSNNILSVVQAYEPLK